MRANHYAQPFVMNNPGIFEKLKINNLSMQMKPPNILDTTEYNKSINKIYHGNIKLL